MRALACSAILAASCATSAAGDDPWLVRDLGLIYREADCVSAGTQAFTEYVRAFGGRDVASGAWTAVAGNLGRKGFDGVITCTFGGGRKTRATLVIHGPERNLGAVLIANHVSISFRAIADELDAAFLEASGHTEWRW